MVKSTKTKKKTTIVGEKNGGRTMAQSKFIIFSGPTYTEKEAIAEAERLFPY